MSFILNGGYYEWEITNNGTTWGAANICEGTLSDGYFDKLSIGNVVARQLKLTLWNVALDPAYPLVLTLKKIHNDGTVESIPKGTYFIDVYGTSPYSEYAEVTAYDALLKSEAPFMTSGEWSAVTDAALAAEIATTIGVTLDPVTAAFLSASLITINETPNIGDNGTTIREMLSVIGCLRGGNWIIDDDNNLQLILLNGTPDSVGIVYIGTDGLFYTDDLINMPDTASFVGFDANGDCQAIPKADITDADEVMYISRSGICEVDTYGNIKVISPDYDTVTIGDEVVDLDVSPVETIKGVEVWAGSKTSYRAWDTDDYATWDDIDGAILVCTMPIMASQTVADNLFAQYEDFTYLPYKASGVYADPELPLGTRLVIKSSTVVLSQRELNIDVLASCGLSADATQQAVSYYPYLTPAERSLQKDIDENYTRITANDDAIIAEAARAKGEEENLASRVTQTAEDFEVALTDLQSQTEQYMRFKGGILELGEKDSSFTAKLSSTELAFTGADGQKAAWISNTQLNIKEAVIETDEKFKAVGGSWVQQVVDNHFQIKWVAD